MTVKIATVPTFEAAADVVVRIWREAGESKLLRFEGFDGVGKSGLTKLVTPRIGAEHVEGDKFVFKPEAPTPYPGCLRQAELDAAIAAAVASGKPVTLDGCAWTKSRRARAGGAGLSFT